MLLLASDIDDEEPTSRLSHYLGRCLLALIVTVATHLIGLLLEKLVRWAASDYATHLESYADHHQRNRYITVRCAQPVFFKRMSRSLRSGNATVV